jgi:hypothetical protein
MSLVINVTDLATRVATEAKSLRTLLNGNQPTLAGLTTTNKTNLVNAINEVSAAVQNASGINDAATATTSSWSSSKTASEIDTRVAAVVDASPDALNTLNELAAALGDDPNFATTVSTALGNRVRFDAAQTLTGPQQAQARTNISAGTSSLALGTTGTTAKAGDYQPTAANITDASATGRSVLTAADAAAARTAIGAGTSNLALGTTSTTAKAGNYAPPDASSTVNGLVRLTGDLGGTATAPTVPGLAGKVDSTDTRLTNSRTPTAHATTHATGGTDVLTPAAIGAAAATHTHTATALTDSTATGRAVLTAVDAPAARSAIGAGTSSVAIGTTTGTAADAGAVGATETDFVALFNAGLV